MIIAGAELFTGNVIMVVGAITRHYSFRKLLRNWIFVYLGNLIGALLYTWLIYRTGLFGNPTSMIGGVEEIGSLGQLAASVAAKKMALPFGQALIRGIFCNMLVILAVIMSAMAKDIVSKMLCCVVPIMTFVAVGFEHCVANMFLIPIGLLVEGAGPASYAAMWGNIIPVTIGNIIGGILILFIHPNRIRQIKNLIKSRKHRQEG